MLDTDKITEIALTSRIISCSITSHSVLSLIEKRMFKFNSCSLDHLANTPKMVKSVQVINH